MSSHRIFHVGFKVYLVKKRPWMDRSLVLDNVGADIGHVANIPNTRHFTPRLGRSIIQIKAILSVSRYSLYRTGFYKSCIPIRQILYRSLHCIVFEWYCTQVGSVSDPHGSAFKFASWIRIRISNADPDPAADQN